MEKVCIYGISSCPWCQKAKEYFEASCIPYSYTDYDLSSSAEQQRISQEMASYQVKGFPVVKYGKEAIVGYAEERYSELLKSSSYQSSK